MDSQPLLGIDTHSSRCALYYGFNHTSAADVTQSSITSFGNADSMYGDNSQLTQLEDFELFDSGEMEKFLTGLVRAYRP